MAKGPAYYQRGTINVWDFIRDQGLNFHLGNAIKYICRAGYKREAYGYDNKIEDLNYQVEMALAGFSKDDIEVKYSDNQLTIKSVESDDKDEKDVIHRGISKRKFSRSFTLADDVVVNGAELKDGMLIVELEKIVPDSKKPRTIDIK